MRQLKQTAGKQKGLAVERIPCFFSFCYTNKYIYSKYLGIFFRDSMHYRKKERNIVSPEAKKLLRGITWELTQKKTHKQTQE